MCAWGTRANSENRKIDNLPIPEREHHGASRGSTGVPAIATQNTRTRLEQAKEREAPKTAWEQNCDYWMAKHEREQRAAQESREKQARIAAEERRVAEARRIAADRDRDLQAAHGEKLMADARRREVLTVIKDATAAEVEEVIRRLKLQGLLSQGEPSFWWIELQNVKSGK